MRGPATPTDFALAVCLGVFCLGACQESGSKDDAENFELGEVRVPGRSAGVPVTIENPYLGDPFAAVTIVAFSSFSCEPCQRASQSIAAIREKYGDDVVRVVWKNFPPTALEKRAANDAAMAAFAVGGNEAFWKFHETAFTNPKAQNDGSFKKWAAEAGLDVEAFQMQRLDSGPRAQVDFDIELAKRLGAVSAPHFYVNGYSLTGVPPMQKWHEVIDREIRAVDMLKHTSTPPHDYYRFRVGENYHRPGPKMPPQYMRRRLDTETVWHLPLAADDPIRGSSDALVTIVEFGDFQCPHTRKAAGTLKQLTDNFGDRIRIVWKDNPLSIHDSARAAAVLGRMAFEDTGNDRFWKAHDAMLDSEQLDARALERVAESVGLDWGQVQERIDQEAFAAKLTANKQLARQYQSPGTPAFFINGRRLPGDQPIERFQDIVAAEVGRAQKARREGVEPARLYETLVEKGKKP